MSVEFLDWKIIDDKIRFERATFFDPGIDIITSAFTDYRNDVGDKVGQMPRILHTPNILIGHQVLPR
jgi:hypothetical protein